ncbi:MAG TPA: DNA double-strand break repair nuclease NurA [Acidimicrobiia bacterium]|nr:DNA double-strand break repair nuclease NurA [Acidimicrobiia bacterium]
MKFTVDPWDPSYGTSNELDPADISKAQIDVDVEVPAGQWAPRRPPPRERAERLVFIDGVRRVEAHVWIDADDGMAQHGICASYAAGAVRCDGAAVCGPFIVRRGLFTTHGGADTIPTWAGDFTVRLAASASAEGLALAVQERMAEAELEAAEAACGEGDVDLVVVDGPLRGRQHLSGAVGYIKTHHVTYLAPELNAVVGRLTPGERSPLFILGTDWSRLSWYFRLPATGASPWSGVVRGECSANLPPADAAALADRVTTALPRYASQAHKDGRAPQNLYPIAGLERDLRHRLGDQQVLYRALRLAAAT